jgi:peptide/nickel transport system substrate-binding protein
VADVLNDVLGRRVNRRTLIKAGGYGALLLIAGCTPQTGGAPATASASASAKRGGTAILGATSDILPNRLFGQVFPNVPLSRLVLNTLTAYDHKTTQPQPQLATSWVWSDNGTTLKVHLRSDAKFHSGRQFGPQDVMFSVEQQRVAANNSQEKFTADVITDMSATGPSEITFRLQHAAANFFDLFEMMFIQDRDTLSDALQGKTLVGTGPFMWKSRSPGDSLDLVRNPNYWLAGRPYLDGVRVRVIPDPQALLSALKAREINAAWSLTATDVSPLQSDSNFHVDLADMNDAGWFIGFNTLIPPFDKKQVRQAIGFAIDRDRIVKEVFNGIGFGTSIPWVPATPSGVYSDAFAKYYSYDPNKAKSLLAQAGVTNFSAELSVNGVRASDPQIAQIIQFNLQQIGIDAKIQVYPAAQFSPIFQQHKFPGMFINQDGFWQVHPATQVLGSFPWVPDNNPSNFKDPVYADLAQRLWTTADATEGSKIGQQITQLTLDDAWAIQLVISPIPYVSTKELHGLYYNVLDFIDLDNAYLA